MHISLIATVLNEADSIRSFLDGLLSQTRRPDEILLSDGGSTDGTEAVIRQYVDQGAPIRLIRAPGANIARGRNLAIAQARGEIIACTDAGCRADPHWLEEITAPFGSPDTGVACGVTRTEARTCNEKSLGILLTPDAGDLDIRTYSPSSRSVAFRRGLWEEVEGYPEELPWAEDTLFNLKLRETGARFVLCSRAFVFWRPPATLRAAARTLFQYGLGDGLARLHGRTYLRILLKVSLGLGLALWGPWVPSCWAFLFLLLGAYYLRMLRINRLRGSVATNSLAFVHRLLLDPVRLIGYLFGNLTCSTDTKATSCP
jgi:glycosyltransferase involved in cell wall biosynthesis